jgi:hypothetical protein
MKGFNFTLPSELQQSNMVSLSLLLFASMALFPPYSEGFVWEHVVKQPRIFHIHYVP